MIKLLRRPSGFTLIEILIVMVIISIVGGVAMLSISMNQTTRYKNLAHEMTSLLALAEEQSLVQGNVYGLAFTSTSFQFYQFDDSSKERPWRPLTDKALGLHHIPDGMQITLKIHDKIIRLTDNSPPAKPQLIIATSGDIIPFNILLGKTDSPPRFQVIGNANGSIESAAISN